VRRTIYAACALIVIAATVAIALLVAGGAPSGTYIAALVSLVIAEVYAAGVLFVFTETRSGDANNFLPAILGALVPAAVSIVVLLAHAVTGVWAIVLLIIAWVIAIILLLVAFSMNRAEAQQAQQQREAQADDPRGAFRSKRGQA